MKTLEKTENEKQLEIYLEMIGKKKGETLELYQVLDLMVIAQDLVKDHGDIGTVIVSLCTCNHDHSWNARRLNECTECFKPITKD